MEDGSAGRGQRAPPEQGERCGHGQGQRGWRGCVPGCGGRAGAVRGGCGLGVAGAGAWLLPGLPGLCGLGQQLWVQAEVLAREEGLGGSQCSHGGEEAPPEGGVWKSGAGASPGRSLPSGLLRPPHLFFGAECWPPARPAGAGAGGQPGRECSEDPLSAASNFTLLVTKADWLLFFTRKKCIDFGLLPMIQEVNS